MKPYNSFVMRMYLLFDIGGTSIRCAFSLDGKTVRESRVFATPQSFREGKALITAFVKDFSGGKKIHAAVGGIAGSFDRSNSRLIGGGSNIPDWKGKNLRKEFERALHASVYFENDAALAGLAEAVWGAGKGKEIIAYLTVGTGLGGARIVKGKIDEHAVGFEPSYQIIDAGKALCPDCKGNRLKYYVSGRGIEMRFGKKPQEITDEKLWDQIAEWLAIGLNNTIVHWSPDVVVLGGSLMKSISVARVRFYLRRIFHAFPLPFLRRAKLGDFNVLYGSLLFLRQRGCLSKDVEP